MGRARHPRQRGGARTARHAVAVARRHRRRSDYMEAMLQRIPLHRLATAEEVAAAVCYLAGARGRLGHRADAGARRRPDGGVTATAFASGAESVRPSPPPGQGVHDMLQLCPSLGSRRRARVRATRAQEAGNCGHARLARLHQPRGSAQRRHGVDRGQAARRRGTAGGRARHAAVAAHRAQRGLEAGDAAGLEKLAQRRDLLPAAARASNSRPPGRARRACARASARCRQAARTGRSRRWRRPTP